MFEETETSAVCNGECYWVNVPRYRVTHLKVVRSRLFHRHQVPLVVVELFGRTELDESRPAPIIEREMHVTVDEFDSEEVVVPARVVEQQSILLRRLEHEREVERVGGAQRRQRHVDVGARPATIGSSQSGHHM